jgi:HEAT repeat protein
MKTNRPSVLLILVAVLLCGCAAQQRIDAPPISPAMFTLDELLSRMPVRDTLEARWVFSSLVGMGQTGVQQICTRLGYPGTNTTVQAEYALQGIATHVTGLNRESDRLMFVSALGKALEQPLSVDNASFLMRLLQVAGRAEVIPVLSRFLADERLCEPAVAAMVAIRTGAVEPLLGALTKATGKNRIEVINGLADLESREAVDLLLKEATSEDAAIRRAALSALAHIGDARAEQVLAQATAGEEPRGRDEVVGYYLLFARRQLETGNTQTAIDICNKLLARHRSSGDTYIRAAALSTLVEAAGPDALGELMATLDSNDKSLRVAALNLTGRIPGEATTARLVGAMKNASSPVRSEIINALGARGDTAVFSEIAGSLSDADSAVRASSIDALVRMKGAKSVQALVNHLKRTQDQGDITAIKKGLVTFPSSVFIAPLVEALPVLTPPSAVAMIDLLGGCGAQVPVEPMLSLARSQNSTVRMAAMKALGTIATAQQQPQLVALLLSVKTESEQAAVLRSLGGVSPGVTDRVTRADAVLEAMKTADPADRAVLVRALGRTGGERAMAALLKQIQSPGADLRETAIRALTDWPTLDGYEPLLLIAKSKEKLNLRVLSLRACVRIVEAASLNAATAVRYHERTLAAAERPEEKRLVLGALGSLRRTEALKLVLPYLDDDSLGVEAAASVGKIASGLMEKKDDAEQADIMRVFLESQVSPRLRGQVAATFDAKERKNDPPKGFTALFNGRDLTGWKGLVENPVARASMDPQRLVAAQMHADSSMRTHWSVVNGILVFDGKGESLCTEKDYEDFEMLVDWKIEKDGDSGIYLRGSPQVQIWDPAKWPEGSGGLYNNQKGPNKPLLRADNPIGDWNTFRIRMIGNRVTVYLNDVLVVDSVALENYWDRTIPIFAKGQIELQSHSTPLFFRNVFIRELPSQRQTFTGNLFNGTDLAGWEVVGGKVSGWAVDGGILFTTGEAGGWLSTAGEFGDFQLDLDFRVPEGGNSGVFIRSPRQGDPAYTGIEIQILDDYAPQYATLRPWQYCGSVYGVQPPAFRATKKANEWQHIQISADGPRLKVVLNSQQIIDADLIAHMDKEALHPGLKRRAGYIGLQCHGARVDYRNIILKELR